MGESMTILSLSKEEMNRRKVKSDLLAQTDELTIKNDNRDKRAKAYKKVRELQDQREIEKLEKESYDYD